MLLDLVRKLKPKPARRLEEIFVPVIFANGRDDDLPGLVAAIKNEPVQYDDKIYAPDEHIEVLHRTLCLSCNRLWILGCTEPAPAHIEPGTVVVWERQGSRRKMLVAHCTIYMNWRWR